LPGTSQLTARLERPADDGATVTLTLENFDGDPDSPLSRELLTKIRAAITEQWLPLYAAGGLAGRDADRDWDWETILTQWFLHLVTVDRSPGSLLVLTSDRRGRLLEGLAKIVHGWRTHHLPREQTRAGRVPRRPRAAYVDTLVVAPWNRVALPGSPSRIRGLGKALLGTAMLLSREAGTRGRIALHAASLARTWYETNLPGAVISYDRRELGDEPSDPTDPRGPYIEVDADITDAYLSVNALSIAGCEQLVVG
jgi:hypothetical protein